MDNLHEIAQQTERIDRCIGAVRLVLRNLLLPKDGPNWAYFKAIFSTMENDFIASRRGPSHSATLHGAVRGILAPGYQEKCAAEQSIAEKISNLEHVLLVALCCSAMPNMESSYEYYQCFLKSAEQSLRTSGMDMATEMRNFLLSLPLDSTRQ